MLPPLELFVDELGRRCLPLRSLAHVLEQACRQEPPPGLHELLQAVLHAEEAPLPGLTPERADSLGTIPGLELAEPVLDPELGLVHPGAYEAPRGHLQSCSKYRHVVFPERYSTPGRCDCNRGVV